MVLSEAEMVARQFHQTYEELAPKFGYETRHDSRTSWERVPDKNRRLMIATAQTLLDRGVIKANGKHA